MRLTISLAALAAILATATPALAGTSDTAKADAKGTVLQPLTITKVDDLDFGWVISTTSAGTVVINADDGSRTQTGGVTLVTSYPGGRATFGGAGTPGNAVTLTLASPTELISTTNPADKVLVNSMTLDSGGSSRTIASDSTFLVGVGGAFAIAANQPNGFYKAQFSVTADYQ